MSLIYLKNILFKTDMKQKMLKIYMSKEMNTTYIFTDSTFLRKFHNRTIIKADNKYKDPNKQNNKNMSDDNWLLGDKSQGVYRLIVV